MKKLMLVVLVMCCACATNALKNDQEKTVSENSKTTEELKNKAPYKDANGFTVYPSAKGMDLKNLHGPAAIVNPNYQPNPFGQPSQY